METEAYLFLAVLAMSLVAAGLYFIARLFKEGDKDADEIRRLGQEAARKAQEEQNQQ